MTLYRSTGDILFRHWDGETIVYHRCSSDTLCLDALSATLLEALVQHPLCEKELCQLVLEGFIVDNPSMLEHSIREKLDELRKLDFIALESD